MSKIKVGLSLGGEQKKTRPLNEIMNEESRIGVAEIDRFVTEFDQEANDGKGANVKVSNVSSEISIELVCNEGKGYGSQTISEVDMADSASALQAIVDANFERPEGDEDEWQPPGAVIANSWRMVYPRKTVFRDGKYVTERDDSKPKDMVSFRTRNGRGAKPAEVHKSQLGSVIELLEGLPAQIAPHREALWADYKSLKNTEAAEAKKAANVDDDISVEYDDDMDE
jgi:hypothetical protein